MALRLAGHVAIGSSAPAEDPITVGYLWMDTAQSKLKICTAVAPITFTEVGGAGGAAWGAITGTLSNQTDLQTALNAKQPLDTDLTTIAGLTPTTDNFMVAAASAWASRTPTQAKTSLALVKADVGLSNVDNTTDIGKPVSTAQQTALDGKQPLDSDLTTIAGLTPTTDNFMIGAASAWASRTPAQAKTALALVKGDVGLGNVDNTSDASKPVSTAEQIALNLKANLASPTFTGTVTTAALAIGDASDITIGATTGTKIGQAGSKIGFYGVTPAVRPTVLTQTYATTSATHAAVTQLAAPAGGTGVAAGGWSTAANRDLAIVSINAARTDIQNLKNFVNQVVDQLQALGLLQ